MTDEKELADASTKRPAREIPEGLSSWEAELWVNVYCAALPRGIEYEPDSNGAVDSIKFAARAADSALLRLRRRMKRE